MWRPTISSDELWHHGILGMQWGHRNGPPYPLDSSNHSAREKEAGWRKSLRGSSAASKKRKHNTDYINQIGKDYIAISEKYGNPSEDDWKTHDKIENEFLRLYQKKEKDYVKQALKTAKKENVEKWGKTQDSNTLFIKGISGSGKSTVANSYRDGKTDIIHLDLYTEKQNQGSKDRNPNFDAYLKKKRFDVRGITTDVKDIKKRFRNMDVFAKHIQDFSKQQYSNNRRVVAEGVQLNDDTIFADKDFFNDKPTITLRINKSVADKRAKERDKDK